MQLPNIVRALCMALALPLCAAPVHAAPSVVFGPGFESVAVGEVFELVLTGQGFGATAGGDTIVNVTGGQNLSFMFSPGLLQVLGVSIDPRWNFAPGNQPGTIDATAGTITGMAFGAFPAVTDDDFTIARFSVKALAAGDATLALTGGTFIGRVGNTAGQSLSASFGAAEVYVSAVPEAPGASTMLLGAGVLLVRALRSGWKAGRQNGRPRRPTQRSDQHVLAQVTAGTVSRLRRPGRDGPGHGPAPAFARASIDGLRPSP